MTGGSLFWGAAPGGVLMRPHDGRIELQLFQIGIAQHRVQPRPDAGFAPAVEPPPDGVPVPESLRQIPPGSAGLGDPDHRLHERPVVGGGRAGSAWAARQQRLDGRPLLVGQGMSARHRTLAVGAKFAGCRTASSRFALLCQHKRRHLLSTRPNFGAGRRTHSRGRAIRTGTSRGRVPPRSARTGIAAGKSHVATAVRIPAAKPVRSTCGRKQGHSDIPGHIPRASYCIATVRHGRLLQPPSRPGGSPSLRTEAREIRLRVRFSDGTRGTAQPVSNVFFTALTPPAHVRPADFRMGRHPRRRRRPSSWPGSGAGSVWRSRRSCGPSVRR